MFARNFFRGFDMGTQAVAFLVLISGGGARVVLGGVISWSSGPRKQFHSIKKV